MVCPAFMGALVVLLGFPFGGFRGVAAACGRIRQDEVRKEGNRRFVKRKDNLTLCCYGWRSGRSTVRLAGR